MSHNSIHPFARLFLALVIIGTGLNARPVRAAGSWYVAPSGNDSNDCLGPASPCNTINGAISKATAGDTIYVAVGTYTGTGYEVVLLDKDATISGGWNASFTAQNGMSTIDGQKTRGGITVVSTALVEYLAIQNGSAGVGAGIWNGGNITINNTVITGNVATGYVGNYQGGGGLYNGGVTILNDSSISGNVGSGITNEGTLTINRSTIRDNTGYGIAVLYGSNAEIGSSLISNNTSDGIFNRFNLTMKNSTVSNNLGRGIQNWNGGRSILNNSTISGNKSGGFLIFSGGTIALYNSTVSNNTADSGGGILMDFGTVLLQNSIVASNTATNGPDCSGDILSLGYNLIGNTAECTFTSSTGDLTDVDANLGQLIGPSEVPDYHPLLANSPAIDAGNPAGCTDQDGISLSTDQRGVARFGNCDIGAYEYTTPGAAVSLSRAGGNNQISATSSAFPYPIQAAAFDNQGSPVPGVTINFAAPGSGPSGTFADTGNNTTTVNTDAGGVATTSVFTANSEAGTYTMSASSPGLGSVHFSLEQVIRPANDNFENAEAITTLPFTVSADITNATAETSEPQLCFSMQRTLWYMFSPPHSMLVKMDTQGSVISSSVNVYRLDGAGINNLSFLTCSSFGGTGTFQAEAGQSYYFQIGSPYGELGNIQLNLQALQPPDNDGFINARIITTLPFMDTIDTTAATLESGEPRPSCDFGNTVKTVWYSFTPATSGAISARIGSSAFSTVTAAYTGSTLAELTEVGCSRFDNPLTFNASANVTYYFQVGGIFGEGGAVEFQLDVTPPPVASFYYFPFDASMFESVYFCDSSFDPGEIGFASMTWDFGDGISSTDNCAAHEYAADGDYNIQHSVTTYDGRTGSTSQIVQVRTHDVSIVRVAAPRSASSGQTRTITISLKNNRYPETVRIELYRSVAGGGFEWIATSTQFVPVRKGNRTSQFSFKYTFSPQDAQIGKVTFKAIVFIEGARDAFQADNDAISTPPTTVR